MRWICMSVWPGLVPTDWSPCLSLSVSHSLPTNPFFFFSLSHISFFRVCLPENAKRPHLLLTLWPVLCLCMFVCAVLLFGSPSQLRDIQACLTLWPAWGLKRHSFSLLSVYQHNAAHWDKWRQPLQYRMGSFGAWIINIFMRPFHSLCGVLCCYGRWHPAVGRALITHGWESVTALCQLLWSAASTQSPGYNVLFMGNNQDLTSERVLKWYLWRGLSSAWKAFRKHLDTEKKYSEKPHTKLTEVVTFLSCLN